VPQIRPIIKSGPKGVDLFDIVGIMAEYMFDGVRYVMDMDVVNFLFLHGRMVKSSQKVIVVMPIGLSRVEEYAVTVKNNNFEVLHEVKLY